MVLGDTRLVAREVLLDTLHRNVWARRNGNKHAMVPTRQGVLMVAAAAAVATADASAAAAVARAAVKPTAADIARETEKHFFVDIENRGKAIKNSTVNFLFGRTDTILFELHHE